MSTPEMLTRREADTEMRARLRVLVAGTLLLSTITFTLGVLVGLLIG